VAAAVVDTAAAAVAVADIAAVAAVVATVAVAVADEVVAVMVADATKPGRDLKGDRFYPRQSKTTIGKFTI
jgi:hypothetical protein